MIDQTDSEVNKKQNYIQNETLDLLNVEGGKVVIDRLLHIFNLRSKVELSGIIGVSPGSIATWQTRSTVPYELLIRIHLATGISIEYLLFDTVVGDINVMQFCPNPTTTPSYATINQNLKYFRYPLGKPAHYDGGSQIIKRLIQILKFNNRTELSNATSVSIGTLSTWQTRKVTPHELLCRIHLATGTSMHYLCFGYEWEDRKVQENTVAPAIKDNLSEQTLTNGVQACSNTYLLENGKLTAKTKYIANDFFWLNIGISPSTDAVAITNKASYFIDKKSSTVTKGMYLFSINDVFQIGELQQLPDSKVYYVDGSDKYPIDPNTTTVHGKVVSILESV
ncbi:helix-turn-helix domain-containing protein [Shewanella sp. VB17]|uniref:helix-turn-helix domain-containing protein n=1 Tax=Shewanella sp. VB17 TaxID=2739432 RepID=UPI001565FD3D|nr:helix-turn-helix domain-containing protein [Shewanella sp. VB17]NRD73229.1 helix-turn-helix domain-containing protein [Shewanella sp. VB17]